jgi:hypothetical protein
MDASGTSRTIRRTHGIHGGKATPSRPPRGPAGRRPRLREPPPHRSSKSHRRGSERRTLHPDSPDAGLLHTSSSTTCPATSPATCPATFPATCPTPPPSARILNDASACSGSSDGFARLLLRSPPRHPEPGHIAHAPRALVEWGRGPPSRRRGRATMRNFARAVRGPPATIDSAPHAPKP